MAAKFSYDAVVVGAGPNGLAAAIELARAGLSVLVLEAAGTVGGGARSSELTLPGFVHDICSAIHPLVVASPFLRSVPLEEHGLKWIHPEAPLAHPFDDGSAAILERSVEATARGIDPDADAYRALLNPLVANWQDLMDEILRPLRLPKHPLRMVRFGFHAVRSGEGLAEKLFSGQRARGLFAGLAAHSIRPLGSLTTAAFGLVLALLGHAVGWPVIQGGSQKIADAMASLFHSLRGEIQTNARVTSMRDIPSSRVILFDLTPRQVLGIVGDTFPPRYRRALERYRYGPGAFKVDWALDGPIPWRASECARSATVHVGGTLEEIARSETAVARGKVSDAPFVLLAQQSLFDPTRAPRGKETAWAYCHVPAGCEANMTGRIEAQIERFAPGFRDRILGRSTRSPAELEQYNANYIGGDIAGGSQDPWQLLIRPALQRNPYSTPVENIYICSTSTPPGAGVHGMCGYHAARAALRTEFGIA